jgi:pimeloyl-ACP methyl ester carboxylesterase
MKKTALYKNKYTISYAEYGDKNGCPLLINHGLIASIDDYYLFERLIQVGAHLISIARPGYGDSSPCVMKNIAEWADIVSIVIEELNISQFDVLGLSSGAPYSYALGCKFPRGVKSIYIFSGIPALYDEEVLSHWPHPVKRNATIAEMQELAYELFFSNLSAEDLERNDIKDSLKNNCFGIAQDLRLRCMDWGFRLQDVGEKVIIQHSKTDQAVPFITALLTSKLLPNCSLDIKETGEHFSSEVLDDFIRAFIAADYVGASIP